jgi:predicted branched-subunit amino acid permease
LTQIHTVGNGVGDVAWQSGSQLAAILGERLGVRALLLVGLGLLVVLLTATRRTRTEQQGRQIGCAGLVVLILLLVFVVLLLVLRRSLREFLVTVLLLLPLLL